MTLSDLDRVLAEQGVRPDAYCLAGGLPNEAYAIEQVEGRWRVYYSERGCRSGLREFPGEAEACADLLSRVLGDPTTRQPTTGGRGAPNPPLHPTGPAG
jgi:hypothetical protein